MYNAYIKLNREICNELLIIAACQINNCNSFIPIRTLIDCIQNCHVSWLYIDYQPTYIYGYLDSVANNRHCFNCYGSINCRVVRRYLTH